MQCVVKCCSVLQCGAVCCSVLQCVVECCGKRMGRVLSTPSSCSRRVCMVSLTATHCTTTPDYNPLQHTTKHCNRLQQTATDCNPLQHITTHCNTLQHTALQHTETNCNTLPQTATHCNKLQQHVSCDKAGIQPQDSRAEFFFIPAGRRVLQHKG